MLVRSVASYVAYWQRWARPWEFQALLKARHSAGDSATGKLFEEAAAEQLWSRHFGADELAELRTMKARTEAIMARRGLDHRELKRGRGGIRDVEFSVQLLQLVHGGRDPALRLRATLPALAELAEAGYVSAEDAAALAVAYRFLRTVEHRLQLVEEAQVHTVPADRESRDRLARVLGFRGRPEQTPADRFDAVLARHQGAGRAIHERLFFRPLLEAFADRARRRGPAVGEEAAPGHGFGAGAAEERLAAFGFADAERTRQALGELTRGLTRSSRLMQQLLPLLLDWLSESPDPDQGLIGLRNLAGGTHRRDLLVTAFRESPEVARRLCMLLGTSRRLAEIITRHPDFVGAARRQGGTRRPRARRARAKGHDRGRIRDRTGGRGPCGTSSRSRRCGSRPATSSASRTCTRPAAPLPTSGPPSSPPACIAVAAEVPMALIAMGSFGGAEISYGSDLDVLVVYEGTSESDAASAERTASELFRLCNGATPAEGIVRIDASLRPEGRKGPLARSLDAFEEYHRRWGATWERQALLRATARRGERPGHRALCDLGQARRVVPALRPDHRTRDPTDEGTGRTRADPAHGGPAVPSQARSRLAQ